ncbi:hypothetical protein [Oceanivirga salmonicida]|uniref:hypothetical protein n=1 Tax=Oceanivirga salmonicida TaxID=1769291 RepID=UPI000831EEF5|nr:hypothetical protein [Oceanivirga salmonicida]
MNTIRDLRQDIKIAYGKDTSLIRAVKTNKGKMFVFNDILSEFYNKPKNELSRNIKHRPLYNKLIKKGKLIKQELLSTQGNQYTSMIDDIGLCEIIASQNNLKVLTIDEYNKLMNRSN